MSDRALRVFIPVGTALFGGLISYLVVQTGVAALIGGIMGVAVGAVIAFLY